jgi:hypothetical protein
MRPTATDLGRCHESLGMLIVCANDTGWKLQGPDQNSTEENTMKLGARKENT